MQRKECGPDKELVREIMLEKRRHPGPAEYTLPTSVNGGKSNANPYRFARTDHLAFGSGGDRFTDGEGPMKPGPGAYH